MVTIGDAFQGSGDRVHGCKATLISCVALGNHLPSRLLSFTALGDNIYVLNNISVLRVNVSPQKYQLLLLLL